MRKIIFSIFAIIIILTRSVGNTFASDVLINEVYYDVDSSHGAESDNEWIELYNTTAADINLTNWTITDNISTTTLPSVVIKQKNVLVIASKYTTWNFWTISGDKIALESKIGNGLGNDGDRLLLKNSNGIEEDKLSYGTDETYSTIADVEAGHSIERVPAESDFIDQNIPTPGAISQISSSTSPTPSPSSSSTSSSFIILSIPKKIDSDQSFPPKIDLTSISYPNEKFFLKGAFKKDGTSNYFGLTKVGDNWIKNGTKSTDQFPITTDSVGKWSGSLEVKVDLLDDGYDGSGDYIFKVARYNSNGDNLTWSNEINININARVIVTEDDQVMGTSSLQNGDIKTIADKPEEEFEDLPEEVFSLERYKQRLSTNSGSSTAAGQILGNTLENNYSNKLFYVLIILGNIILLGAGGLFWKLKNNSV